MVARTVSVLPVGETRPVVTNCNPLVGQRTHWKLSTEQERGVPAMRQKARASLRESRSWLVQVATGLPLLAAMRSMWVPPGLVLWQPAFVFGRPSRVAWGETLETQALAR